MAEQVLVTASENDYATALSSAMVKLKNQIAPEAQVHRLESHCEEMRDWFVYSVDGQLTPGETGVMVNVLFQLAGTDL